MNIFSAVGVAKAEAVDEQHAEYFKKWLSDGGNASMGYMSNYLDLRLDPRKLHPGTKSIVSVALNYYPIKKLSKSQYQFAYYAYGQDYHDVMRKYLRELALEMGIEGRICVDTAPILERYWAWKAGLGWIGKNHNLIVPGTGSFVLLGEILTDTEFETYGEPIPPQCGDCRLCTSQCKALQTPTFASCECHSYKTIEDREVNGQQSTVNGANENDNENGEFNSKTQKLNNSKTQSQYIYGCDCCQLLCPHNQDIPSTSVPEFQPSEEFLSMTPSDWHNLTPEQYKSLFRHSAVRRAKYEKIMANIGQKS